MIFRLGKMLRIYLLITIISTLITCPATSTTVIFNKTFRSLSGGISTSPTGDTVTVSLNNNTGSSGFTSLVNYTTGVFGANIKLPSQNYTAAIIVTFYLSNKLPDHDEVDFEFLGHDNGQEWVLQTNYFGYGSKSRGREERYKLWFDPTIQTHKYSVFWDETRLVYYVDDFPIRVVQNVVGGNYPSKAMAIYGTIWNATWATKGGMLQADFTYQPFVVEYTSFTIDGCWVNPRGTRLVCGGSIQAKDRGNLSGQQLVQYNQFRQKYMVYSYCDDKRRYDPPLPECLVQPGSSFLQ